MTKKEVKEYIKKKREEGGYATFEIIVDALYDDTEDIPEKYLDLFVHKIETQPIIIYTSKEGLDSFNKAIKEYIYI